MSKAKGSKRELSKDPRAVARREKSAARKAAASVPAVPALPEVPGGFTITRERNEMGRSTR